MIPVRGEKGVMGLDSACVAVNGVSGDVPGLSLSGDPVGVLKGEGVLRPVAL